MPRDTVGREDQFADSDGGVLSDCTVVSGMDVIAAPVMQSSDVFVNDEMNLSRVIDSLFFPEDEDCNTDVQTSTQNTVLAPTNLSRKIVTEKRVKSWTTSD